MINGKSSGWHSLFLKVILEPLDSPHYLNS
jgi:hypothetical protein